MSGHRLSLSFLGLTSDEPFQNRRIVSYGKDNWDVTGR